MGKDENETLQKDLSGKREELVTTNNKLHDTEAQNQGFRLKQKRKDETLQDLQIKFESLEKTHNGIINEYKSITIDFETQKKLTQEKDVILKTIKSQCTEYQGLYENSVIECNKMAERVKKCVDVIKKQNKDK